MTLPGRLSQIFSGAAVVVVAISAAGCFSQSGQQAVNCEELRSVMATTSADLSAAIEQALADPQRMAGEIGKVADRLRQQADNLSDEELRSAMKELADSLGSLSMPPSGGPGAVPPSPPDLARLSQIVDRKCPV